MNNESKDTLRISITGVLTIGKDELEHLLRQFIHTNVPAPIFKMPMTDAKPVRISYTVKQTAELLGVGNATVYRLLKRGLLRSSSALRTKIIPKSEIDRFLKETTQSDY